jgi:ABC-type branched-subunit amino acid transport system permease subunit
LYKGIDLGLDKLNVLDELKKQYKAFSEWQKQSLRVALFIYPFAAAGGFMLGGSVGSGKSPGLLMEDYRLQIILIIVIIILVPLCYLLAKWMTRVTFGKYIDALKEKIDELEREG